MLNGKLVDVSTPEAVELLKKSEGGGGTAMSNWTSSNLDPDMVRRHSQSLKRAGFTSNAHAKGRF